MMELKQFIKAALVDIIQAIEEARSSLGSQQGKSICPPIELSYSHRTKIEYDIASDTYLQQVEFDVAVSAETKDASGGNAGINVLGMKASIGADANETNTSISRIRFHVPIGLTSKPAK